MMSFTLYFNAKSVWKPLIHMCVPAHCYILFLSTGFCSFTESTLCDYVLIQEQKTWDEAQAYCRRTHIDLATVQSTEDLASLQEAVYKMAEMTWIGLYNDINSWRWSYQDEKITFQNWYIGEPNNFDGHEECAVMQENGTWNDCGCTQLFPFFCYRGKKSTFLYIKATNASLFVLSHSVFLLFHP
uniref:C-type lectin domain-containing protein n=1 Tax=Cyprinus carpio TaxID=7962 RepID=A0A8C2CRB8_CYPCA